MVEYHCELCSFTTNRISHYERHCKTKKHLGKVKEQEDKKKDDAPKMHPDAPKMHPDAPKKIDNKTCQFCEKRFTRTTGLKKHLQICSLNKTLKNAPKCTQNDSKMTPNDSKMTPNDSKMTPNDSNDHSTTIKNTGIINNLKKYICQYCNKEYSKNSNLHKHLKKCKVKIDDDEKSKNNNMQIELLKKEVNELKENNKVTTINNNIQNNTINYLNLNFQNMQTIEDFLENLKNKYKLSITDRRCLLDTYNECGIDAFAETFSIIMKKYQSEQVEKGLLPTMPIVCTDGNLRSMKEYHENGWQTTYSDSTIDKMIDISNDQIYESENTMVFLKSKDRKKIHNRIKKDNTLLNLEEIKKNYISKTNKTQELYLKNDEFTKNEYEKDRIELLETNLDFSIINDEYIEKFSKI